MCGNLVEFDFGGFFFPRIFYGRIKFLPGNTWFAIQNLCINVDVPSFTGVLCRQGKRIEKKKNNESAARRVFSFFLFWDRPSRRIFAV